MKKSFPILFVFSVLLFYEICFADYFVAHQDCNIGLGPGTNYEIIDKMKKWDKRRIPDSFKDYTNEWIAVGKVPVTFETEGWYPKVIETINDVSIGSTIGFEYFKNGETLQANGYLITKLNKEKEMDGLLFKCAKFRVTEYVYGKWVQKTKGEIISDDQIERYVRVKKLGEMELRSHVKQFIIDRKIMIGMTSQEVLLSWGEPNDINTTVSSKDRMEQWVYRHRNSIRADYLYFRNSILETYQLSGR